MCCDYPSKSRGGDVLEQAAQRLINKDVDIRKRLVWASAVDDVADDLPNTEGDKCCRASPQRTSDTTQIATTSRPSQEYGATRPD